MSLIRGDTLLVWDRSLGRATYIAPNGAVGRIDRVNALRMNEVYLGGSPDGWAFLQWVQRIGDSDPEKQRRIVVRTLKGKIDTLSSTELGVKSIIAFGQPRFVEPIFRPSPSIVPGNGDIWHAAGGPFEVARLDGDGKELAIYRYAVQRQPVSADLFKWYANSIVANNISDDEKIEVRKMFDRRGYADSIPSIDRIALGTDGRVWLRKVNYFDDESAKVWLVIEPDGNPVAWVTVPSRFNPSWFSPDHLLGIARDSMDVQYIEQRNIIPVKGS